MTAHIEADVVIIGSGVAGTLTAWRLARNGVKNVVILEAGPRIDRGEIIPKFRESPVIDASSGFPDPDWAPRPAWREKEKNPYIQSVGPESSRLEYLRVVGGTTWHWAGCTPRHLPVDFRLKSTYGVGADWPIDYTALEPYYTEAEYELGVAGDPNSDYGSPRSRPFPLPPIPLGYADKYVRDRLKAIGISFQARPAARATQPYNGRNQCQGFGTCSPMDEWQAQGSSLERIEITTGNDNRPTAFIGQKKVKIIHTTSSGSGHIRILKAQMQVMDAILNGMFKLLVNQDQFKTQIDLLAECIRTHRNDFLQLGICSANPTPVGGFRFSPARDQPSAADYM